MTPKEELSEFQFTRCGWRISAAKVRDHPMDSQDARVVPQCFRAGWSIDMTSAKGKLHPHLSQELQRDAMVQSRVRWTLTAG